LNRSDFQRLSATRIREARVLYRERLFEGSYYLAGYAVECALKACIAKQTRECDFPDKVAVNKSYSHDLDQLLGVAGLKPALRSGPQRLQVNWAVTKDWSEEKRYDLSVSQRESADILTACTSWKYGVLTWLRNHW